MRTRSLSFIKNLVKTTPVLAEMYRRLNNFIFSSNTSVGLDNVVVDNGVFMSECHVSIIGDCNSISYGKKTRLLNCTISIQGVGHKLVIGDGCVIRNCNFILEDRECGITIGHGTTVEGADFSAGDDSTSIEVGADCMFSRGIDIRTCDAHSIVQIDSGARINNSKSVHIGDHCWVAADVKILKGVVIESDSVIAAGAIVTHSVSRGCVVAGVPAHVIKSGVTWYRERV